MAWLTDEEDSKVQVIIHFLINTDVTDQLDLNLVEDICIHNRL